MSTVTSKEQVIEEMHKMIEDMRNDDEISLVLISRRDTDDASAMKIVTARADMSDVRTMIQACLSMTEDKGKPTDTRIH